jgi:hypothetical protein
MTGVGAPAARLFAFTIDADTAQIVKIESVGGNGGRHQISDEEKKSLVREGSIGSLKDVLQLAFEAGLACALGEDAGQGRRADADEDSELHDLLLAQLMEHSAVRDLMRGDALNRAILEALVQNWIAPQSAARGRMTTAEAQRDSAPSARAH